MKKSVFVLPLCALFFTNALAAVNAKDIDALTDRCMNRVRNHDLNACTYLHRVIQKLTDQGLLAHIATESKATIARSAAVIRLTDQSALAKVALADQDAGVRQAAAPKLTDQALLAKVAVDAGDWAVRNVAVGKLTDQATLAKIAVEDKDPRVRQAAAGKVADQVLLAKIAVEDKEPIVRQAAAGNLTNQEVLAKVAVEDQYAYVRLTAVGNLTNNAILAKIAVADKDADVRLAAVGNLTDQALLAGFAGNLSALTSDARQSAARMGLAIQEPRIKGRLPRIVLASRVSSLYQSYRPANGADGFATLGMSEYFSGKPVSLSGESVSFELSQDRKRLAMENWKTQFPERTVSQYFPAEVHGEDLLAELLHGAVFTEADLAELSFSEIPEVRLAAVANLTDQATLAKIAVEDKHAKIRQAAIGKLTDQALLAKIAAGNEDRQDGLAAKQRLTQIRKEF